MNIDFPLIFFIYSNDLQFKFVFIQKITKNKNNYPNIAHKLEKTPCLNMEHYMLCVERRKSWRTKKKNSLPSVKRTTLGKDVRLCRVSPARRSAKITPLPSVVALTLGKGLSLCRVPRSLHSAKLQKFFFLFLFLYFINAYTFTDHIHSHIYIHRSHIYHKFSHIHHIYHKSPHKSTSPSSIHQQIHIKFTSTSHEFTNDTYPHAYCSMQTDTLDVHAYRSGNRKPSHKTFPAITSI